MILIIFNIVIVIIIIIISDINIIVVDVVIININIIIYIIIIIIIITTISMLIPLEQCSQVSRRMSSSIFLPEFPPCTSRSQRSSHDLPRPVKHCLVSNPWKVTLYGFKFSLKYLD